MAVVYREQVVEESHLVRIVRLYETRRDEAGETSETRREKRFLRGRNKIFQGSEYNLLCISFM